MRQGGLLATSFHPELTGDARVHALFVGDREGATRYEPATPSGRRPSTRRPSIDAKRGKLFAKLIKNIEVAARTGGGDPAGNPTLYDAIQKAKEPRSPTTTSTARSSAGPGPRPAAPTTRRSCTRATRPVGSRCSSSA